MNADENRRRPGLYGSHGIDVSMPVVILGGKENSLSLTRSLGQVGIEISVSGTPDCWGLYSTFCANRYIIPRQDSRKEHWRKLLLGPDATIQQPHVILPCCDDGIEFIAENDAELRQRHVFDGGSPQQRRALLDKLQTLELAQSAGIATPNFWPVSRGASAAEDIEDLRFPVIVKPFNTFNFAKVFGRKFFTVQSGTEELQEKIEIAHDAGFDVCVVEMIPGPDSLLSSYYTYINDDGECLFHFTKKVFRRYPVNSGGATYHATEWLPETAREGLKFFQNTNFRGLGNIEFKTDTRDGQLKIIEVNARFTAAQELAVRAGAPIDLIVYCQLTGQPVPTFTEYAQDMRYWYPVKDFLAFLQLRNMGQLSFGEWIRSLEPRRHVDPLFDLSDVRPLLGATGAVLGKMTRRAT